MFSQSELEDEKGEEVSSGPAETGLGLPGFLSAGFPDDQPHTDTCTVKSAKYKTAYEIEMSAQYGYFVSSCVVKERCVVN